MRYRQAYLVQPCLHSEQVSALLQNAVVRVMMVSLLFLMLVAGVAVLKGGLVLRVIKKLEHYLAKQYA